MTPLDSALLAAPFSLPSLAAASCLSKGPRNAHAYTELLKACHRTMASSSVSSRGRDERVVNLLSIALQKTEDFMGRGTDAREYAAQVAAAARANNATEEEFKDQIMCIVANIKNLNGELGAGSREGRAGISAAELAVMDANEMRSRQQKKSIAAAFRKRAREQTNVDKTSLHCTKCGLVRRERLNINELALDSAESGSHFEYNFDNTCACSHSSDEERSSSDDEDDDGATRKGGSATASSRD
ncbi:hypothetical protein LSCM1_00028 [Leishmania martiniquensis]|uniref:TFIIS central domain-containing protein n=1 Tax=Leishmania martiniquensis TaxID=1580590 RepID=A0A836GRX7_9TRYP|nr:hypothetical protein LSCM1_00028 [Leishmania martiniquensis]